MKTKYEVLLTGSNVIGVVTRFEDIFEAQCAPLGALDGLELRADMWPFSLEHKNTKALIDLRKPLIITPRDASEGGMRKDWTLADRIAQYRLYMPYAAFIDVEASKAAELKEVIAEAKEQGVGVIISYHNFIETPSYAEIIIQGERCAMAGGDVLKMAVNIQTLGDVAELADAVSTLGINSPFKIVVMGTEAPLGKIYRILDLAVGGPFAYGWLSKPLGSGQLKAVRIKSLLSELQ